MSGYRSPDRPVAALLTRHRASALAFLADRFYDYQLLIVQSLGELLAAAPAQPPQLLIVDLLTVREGAERILLAVRATEATALASVVLLSDGPDGWKALLEVRQGAAAGTLFIFDAKRADAGHTSAAYARAAFDALGMDALTVHAYHGADSLAEFTGHVDRGVYVVCRTSNPG